MFGFNSKGIFLIFVLSTSNTLFAKSGFKGTPWNSCLFSTAYVSPFPLIVLAKITVGLSFYFLANSNDLIISLMSCPSIIIVYHPKALNLPYINSI